MSILLLGNLSDDVTDEEVRALLVRYGLPTFDHMAQIEGDGSRPAFTLSFERLGDETLQRLAARIHDVFWKGNKISALVLRERFN
ncbi:MAG: RNA-binding protein [Cupriavidus sp.]|nr:RNA-binding protein [Cupriavidus sp.]